MFTKTALFLFVLSVYDNDDGTNAFSMLPKPITRSCSVITFFEAKSSRQSSSSLFAKSRKARRAAVQKQGRSKDFRDVIEDAQGTKEETEKTQASGTTATSTAPPSASTDLNPDPSIDNEQRAAAIEESQRRYEMRPEVSTVIIDEETGTEILAQGQKVMDVVTRKAVKLSNLGPDARFAQMFPGAPPDVREKYRFDSKTIEVPDMVEQLKEACFVSLDDDKRGIPVHPSVANKAIDFVLANRDFLGYRMKKTLGRWTFHVASKGDITEAKEVWKKLWINFLTLENHISAPFRQILQDAEGRIGPNFGNLEIMSFCDGDLYERVGNYLVLKGMVAHWEKKVLDADSFENDRKNKFNRDRGDPKRFMKDAPILFSLKECTQVCAMAQQMCKQFVETEALYADFPPEIVFLEDALKIKGGTALRKYMIDEFCPARGITPEGLREGMRRLYIQLENMQLDPYADVTMKVEQLYKAMAVGTDDARDPYEKYLSSEASIDPNNPAFFETYTFNYPVQSLVRFLDNTYESAGGMSQLVGPKPKVEASPESESGDSNPFGALTNMFNSIGDMGEKNLRAEPKIQEDNRPYNTPKERAVGRQHDLRWFEELNSKDGDLVKEVAPGRIIPDE